MRQVDDFPDLIDACIMVEFRERLFRLFLGFDVAHGNFEKILISRGRVYQQLVIRYQHRIRIIITAVEPLLNILAYCVDADNVLPKSK